MKHEDTPDKEVSISQLSQDYAKAVEKNQGIVFKQNELDQEIAELASLTKRAATLAKSIRSKEAVVGKEKKVDTQSIKTKMDQAEKMNSQVRANRIYNEVNAQVVDLRKKSLSLSDKITAVSDKKAELLSRAKFPIKGLVIDDEGVTFENIPFIQCSAAQRIRVSVAIGLAMNPKLRVLLIREGSMLDSKNLEMVAKMAEKADAQIWVERVSKGKECQIIMEDGSVQIQKKEVVHVK